MTTQRIVIPLYLLALLFIGLGYLAILPAFEGLDETAHYSSIRQIADTGTIPVYGASFIDEAIRPYRGPMPDIPGYHYRTYKMFFTQRDLVENYFSSYRKASFPAFRPSQEQNWEAQHPPLYYILLAAVDKATERLPFLTHFFILRLVSFLIALAGVAFGLLACRQTKEPTRNDPVIMGFMLYPIVLPMFFVEFTRIGNDCLCLLLVGFTAFLLSKWMKDENNKRLSVSIGVALGLGLLTKAFFIPIIVALGGFLLLRMFSDKQSRTLGSAHWKNLMLLFLPAALIGGGWYVHNLIAFGNLLGSNDANILANKGGLFAGLKNNFSLYAVIRGVAALFKSYIWAGTQSLAKLSAFFYTPLTVLVVSGFAAFAVRLKYLPFKDIAWLPVLLFAFFGGGLFYHILTDVASVGSASTPGWYLHILMPWVAPVLGIGISSLLEIRHFRPIFIGLLLYAILFQIAVLWAQVALFAGCATKTDDSFYAFTGHYICLDQFSAVVERLSVLGSPVLAVAGFGGGLICVLLLIGIQVSDS
jgi:hypothetical protein